MLKIELGAKIRIRYLKDVNVRRLCSSEIDTRTGAKLYDIILVIYSCQSFLNIHSPLSLSLSLSLSARAFASVCVCVSCACACAHLLSLSSLSPPFFFLDAPVPLPARSSWRSPARSVPLALRVSYVLCLSCVSVCILYSVLRASSMPLCVCLYSIFCAVRVLYALCVSVYSVFSVLCCACPVCLCACCMLLAHAHTRSTHTHSIVLVFPPARSLLRVSFMPLSFARCCAATYTLHAHTNTPCTHTPRN